MKCKKTIQKAFLILLVITLIVSTMPVSIYANNIVSNGTCGNNLTWTLYTDGTLNISGTGDMTHFISNKAPWYPYRYSVSEIKVVVEKGVTSIGYQAFYDYSRLKSVTLPDSIKIISDFAFYSCENLTDITIPDGVTSIYYRAFANCTGITDITIPDSVTFIDSSVFSGCSGLESLSIPFVGNQRKTNTETNQYPFGYIFGTSSYTDGKAVKQDYYGDSTLYFDSETYYIPSKLKTVKVTGGNILRGAFYGCSQLENVFLPNGISAIGDSAFYGCAGLKSISIPDGVNTIGKSSFANCYDVQNVSFTNSVTDISDYAFHNCIRLTDVYYDGSESDWEKISIGSNNSSLTNATIHCALHIHIFGNWVINKNSTCVSDGEKYRECTICKTKETETISALGHRKNSVLSTNSTTFPFELNDGVYSSTNKDHKTSSTFTVTALTDCELEIKYKTSTERGYDSFTITQNSTTVVTASGIDSAWKTVIVNLNKGDNVYLEYSKDITSSEGDDTVYFILNSPTISVDEYKSSCDQEVVCDICLQLIESTEHSYDNDCDTDCNVCGHTREASHFYDNDCDVDCNVCGYTREITHFYDNDCDTACNICGYIREISHSYDNDCDTDCNVCGNIRTDISHTFDGNGDVECNYCYFYRHIEYIVTDDKVTITGCDKDFSGELVIPSTLGGYAVTYIGNSAFYKCENLHSVIIPDSVTEIGNNAFKNCYDLTTVSLGNNVTKIGDEAFSCCTDLYSIILPDSVTAIGNSAFTMCENLFDLRIPASVTHIGAKAFDCCWNIYFYVDENNTEYCNDDSGVLFNKKKTVLIKAPSSISGEYIIPDGVTTICQDAFSACNGLTSLTIPASVTTIERFAIDTYGCLETVYYRASESDYQKINIDSSNTDLKCATLYYNSCIGTAAHTYTNACDSVCNVCNDIRTITHVYDNSCDEECNICFDIRQITHSFENRYNKTEHWRICLVCKLIENRNYHIFENDRDSTCNDCEYERAIMYGQINTVSLTLNNSLTYNVKVSGVKDGDFTKVVFTIGNKTYTETEYTVQDDILVFSLRNIGPHLMTEQITAKLYINEIIRGSYETTLESYLKTVAQSNTSYKAIVDAVLNYGAAAQIYENYKISDLANKSLTDAEKIVAKRDYSDCLDKEYITIQNPLANWKGVGLYLNTNATMKLAFETDEKLSGISVLVENEFFEQVALLENCIIEKDGKYVFYFDGFGIGELDTVFLFTLYKDGIPISDTLSYSVESYASKATENIHLSNLVDALMNYGKIAKSY